MTFLSVEMIGALLVFLSIGFLAWRAARRRPPENLIELDPRRKR